MGDLDDRIITVLLGMIVGITILSLICFLTLFIQPNLPFNPLSPARATGIAATRLASLPTPTATPYVIETYPPTWTLTPTRTPAPTKTPTETRTPTPTYTPSPTRTPTYTPSPTPLPPTNTPTPTNTPLPPPYFVVSHSSENRCADLKLEIHALDEEGLPLPGLMIEYGEVDIPESNFVAGPTNANGMYGVLLINGFENREAARQLHLWYTYVVEGGVRASEVFTFTTDPIWADNPEKCEDYRDETDEEDTDEDDEEEFVEEGCIEDPCRSGDAVNVKIITWQRRPPIPTPTPTAASPEDGESAIERQEQFVFVDQEGRD